jgi:hypothetical protein
MRGPFETVGATGATAVVAAGAPCPSWVLVTVEPCEDSHAPITSAHEITANREITPGS